MRHGCPPRPRRKRGGRKCFEGSFAGKDDPVASRRHVLVVSTVELAGAAIEDLVGDDATTMVVVPAVRQSPLQWLANDEDRARRTAERASERLADETPGDTITAR